MLATGRVFLRVTAYVNVLNPELGRELLRPLLSMALLSYAIALLAWRSERRTMVPQALQAGKPFQLRVALQFALILTMVTLLSVATRHFLGESGINSLAIVTGLSGVDAITLSLIHMTGGALGDATAAKAILLAAASNNAMKAVLASSLCGGSLARKIALYATILLAVTALWFWLL